MEKREPPWQSAPYQAQHEAQHEAQQWPPVDEQAYIEPSYTFERRESEHVEPTLTYPAFEYTSAYSYPLAPPNLASTSNEHGRPTDNPTLPYPPHVRATDSNTLPPYPYYPPPAPLEPGIGSDPWFGHNMKPMDPEYAPHPPLSALYPSSSVDTAPSSIFDATSPALPQSEAFPLNTGSPNTLSVASNLHSPRNAMPTILPRETAESVSGSSKRLYACDRPGCNSSRFTRAADLQRHIQTIHATRKFHCDTPGCSRAFSRRDHLTEHLRSFHHVEIRKRAPGERNIQPNPVPFPEPPVPVAENPPPALDPTSGGDATAEGHSYPCTQCGKSFVRAGDLRKHEKVHVANKDREHRCDTCQRAFLYPKDLERHKRTQHPSADTPAFFCPKADCIRSKRGKPFYRKDKLQEHSRKIHGMRLDELEKQENG